jgi:hypothetical protein
MMKKRVVIFFLVLIYVTTIIGCTTFDSNIDSNMGFKEKSEKITNIIIKEYNEKYGDKIEKSKLSIYSIKPYEQGVLLLIGYKNTVPGLKLLYLIKDRTGYHVSKYSEGQYDINKIKVNKVEDGNNAIYFGSLDNSFFTNNQNIGSKVKVGGITISLDDGKNFKEEISNNQKGYIIISDSKAMIVDFYLYNLINEKSYFIKNFINYSSGINESLWK